MYENTMGGPAAGPAAPVAGWYDDPQVAGTLRYWDGAAWSEHTAPGSAPQPVADVYAPYQRTMTSRPQLSFVDLNRQSLIAIAFAVGYAALAVTAGIVLLGIVPILAAFQALQRKEPLAPVAMVLGVLSVAFAVMTIVG